METVFNNENAKVKNFGASTGGEAIGLRAAEIESLSSNEYVGLSKPADTSAEEDRATAQALANESAERTPVLEDTDALPMPRIPVPQPAESSSHDSVSEQLAENLEDGVRMGRAVSQKRNQKATPTTAPKFTIMDEGKNAWSQFAREYKPAEMAIVPCVAETTMLMQYMVAMERYRGATMSFPACGVDPAVFHEHREAFFPTDPMTLSIDNGTEEPGSAKYEMISVDDVYYLSCTTDCLDEEYLHAIIAEATEAIYTHDEYIFTMVGPRPVAARMDPSSTDRVFIETLRLNSYELSVLIGYMENIEKVSTEHCMYNGRAALKFVRG